MAWARLSDVDQAARSLKTRRHGRQLLTGRGGTGIANMEGRWYVGTNPKWRLGMCVEPLGVRLVAVVGLEKEVLFVPGMVHIG